MKTYLSLPGKPAKEIHNLGWLLRNWQKVSAFRFYYSPDGSWDGILSAQLKDGGFYRTHFASLSVCFRFLRRPVFDTLPLTVLCGRLADAGMNGDGFGDGVLMPRKEHSIGSPEYLAILSRKAEFVRGEYDNAGLHRWEKAQILPA